jgi:hypothetical protein
MEELKVDIDDVIELAVACKRIREFFFDCYAAKIEFSGRLGDLGEIDFTDELLDILGIPADNTVEANACSYANEFKIWPSWGFCRDYWDDLLLNSEPDRFIREALDFVSNLSFNDRTMYETAYSWTEEDKSDPKYYKVEDIELRQD